VIRRITTLVSTPAENTTTDLSSAAEKCSTAADRTTEDIVKYKVLEASNYEQWQAPFFCSKQVKRSLNIIKLLCFETGIYFYQSIISS